MTESDIVALCSALNAISDSIIERTDHHYSPETDEAIRYGCGRIENGLCVLAQSINRLSSCFEKK